ncbi:hypothetical protein EK904_009127 [Melospiza melodia maxima]|nr:hypothetical protein EK904_009127 [Melospiza melodia maxima]
MKGAGITVTESRCLGSGNGFPPAPERTRRGSESMAPILSRSAPPADPAGHAGTAGLGNGARGEDDVYYLWLIQEELPCPAQGPRLSRRAALPERRPSPARPLRAAAAAGPGRPRSDPGWDSTGATLGHTANCQKRRQRGSPEIPSESSSFIAEDRDWKPRGPRAAVAA